ncbi:hypothetical protein KIPB_001745 [Kipferlia bialata]|uniref:Uncharacterized protein n=1 Tax=Kipferlia bialata TaxID=797122 RepID=A0A9K3CPE1_9EUKA|nr:hypothetical protein KIPB_001745 [Kipferlia bialata]|eukprot:g1745.t1
MVYLTLGVQRVRRVYRLACETHPGSKMFLRWAAFEEKFMNTSVARGVYEAALSMLGADVGIGRVSADTPLAECVAQIGDWQKQKAAAKAVYDCEAVILAWAAFEERQDEVARARALLQKGCKELPKLEASLPDADKADSFDVDSASLFGSARLQSALTSIDKRHGSADTLRLNATIRRRALYREAVKRNSADIDAWLNLCTLEVSVLKGAKDAENLRRIRATFEEALSHTPDEVFDEGPEDRVRCQNDWRRYLWLWVWFGAAEELYGDKTKATELYETALEMVPVREGVAVVEFPQIWCQAALFHVRQGDATKAREVFERAVDVSPCVEVFRHYCDMETSLGEAARVGSILEREVAAFVTDSTAWLRLVNLSIELKAYDKARRTLDEALLTEGVDYPEVLWARYLSMETDLGNTEHVRALYARVAEASPHSGSVHVARAQFESGEGNIDGARHALRVGAGALAQVTAAVEGQAVDTEARDERAMLLGAWLELEEAANGAGMEDCLEEVQGLQPRRDDKEEGWVFPEEEETGAGARLAQMAAEWSEDEDEDY